MKPLLLVALFSPCIYFIAETIGISNTTSSESGVFLACIPVISLIASTLILKKKPAKIQVAGISITLICGISNCRGCHDWDGNRAYKFAF